MLKSGIVIINKEKGMTSQMVVSRLKKILNIKKAGHIGTLDPLAEGVLPILIGDATKLSKYLIEHDKSYRVILKLGIKTETADSEGEIIEKNDNINFDEKQIKSVLSSFIGKQNQKPHIYSAVKIDGKKLYEYARNNEKIDIPSREIEIYNINFIEYRKNEAQIIFDVACSKGTYIRVLCEDIAEKLGTIGFMKKLIRLSVSEYKLENAYTLDCIDEKNIISVENMCINYDLINVNKNRINYFLNGGIIDVDKLDGVYRIYSDKRFIGLGVVVDKKLKRDVIVDM